MQNIKIFDLQQGIKYKVLAFRSFYYNERIKCAIRLQDPITNKISETFLPTRYELTPSNHKVDNVYFTYGGFINSSKFEGKYHDIIWEGDYKKYIVYNPISHMPISNQPIRRHTPRQTPRH